MRGSLAAAVGLGLVLMGACGGSSGGTTGTSGGISGSTGGTTGSATTGGTTTGGTSGLSPGSPCTANVQCQSDACGIDGTGNCCSALCSTSDATCGASGCDSSGACTYPVGTMCGASVCSAGILTGSVCGSAGTCVARTPLACAGNLKCADAATCLTSCATSTDCISGFWCSTNACIAVLTNGSTCAENDACASGVCGLSGSGNCCATACDTTDATCGATACDSSGACNYPSATTSCGASSCTGSMLTATTCTGTGMCMIDAPAPCPNHLKCADAASCLATCTAITDCTAGFWCNAGTCTAQQATGACTENDACTSGTCGITGTGNCCTGTAACSTASLTCGATGCDATTGACSYPAVTTACGNPSCAGSTQTDAPLCDGLGTCQAPTTTNCAPFICGANACLTSCTDNSACGSSDFCDVGNAACCSGLGNFSQMTVDGATGSDSTACCGILANGACQTLTKAMTLIAAAQAQGVKLTATVNGGSGDWAPAGETYPIVLGWGVQLTASGVYFLDTNAATSSAIIDINSTGADTTFYATILGTGPKVRVGIGMNAAETAQTSDTTSLSVESGNTLYLSNVYVNGNRTLKTTAINLAAGATLWLGQDQSGLFTGTVDIGNGLGAMATDGWDGITCGTDGVSLGCTIKDTPSGGSSGVIIQGQEDRDIDAEDFAHISLTASPVIGTMPANPGFGGCANKLDSDVSNIAVLLNGKVNMTFQNGMVQCIGGTSFALRATAKGSPTLIVDSTSVQNTDLAVYASAGTATVTHSTFRYNYFGVQQDTDGTNNGAIDLSGGGNTVICSNSAESSLKLAYPGVDVFNTSTANLDADNVAWDTASPDSFICDTATPPTCSCAIASCSTTAGSDDMDAVTTTDAGISTTGNTLSPNGCN